MTEYKLDGTRWRSAYKRNGSKCPRETPATLDTAGETALTNAKAAIAKYDPDGTALKFAFITDLHRSEEGVYTTNAIDDRPSMRLLSRLCDEVDLDAVFCGGDIVNGRDENASYVQKNMQDVVDDFDDLIPNTPIYFCCGNHDKRYSMSRSTNMNAWLHDLWDQVQYDGNGVELHYIDATNFYADFARHKVRIIFINQYDDVDSDSSWYANENISSSTGIHTHGSTAWHSALPTTDKADWLVGVVYHGADTGNAGDVYVTDFKFDDVKNTLDEYITNGGKGVLGAIAGHYHNQQGRTILPSLNVAHVGCAYATSAQAGLATAYCISVFVVDSETGMFQEIRVGRGQRAITFKAFGEVNANGGLLQNGTFAHDAGATNFLSIFDGNHVRFDNYWNGSTLGINLTNTGKNWGYKNNDFVSSDTDSVLFSAQAGDIIKTEIIINEANLEGGHSSSDGNRAFSIFSPQIANMVTGTIAKKSTEPYSFSKEIQLTEDKDVTAIGFKFTGNGYVGPLDFTLNIYKNGVKLVRSE